MRVVVTGGTGRAGQWVVRTLAEAGHEVVNVDLADRPDLELPGQFCRVDLTDAGKVYDALFQFRPEGICHLAANPAPSGQAQIDVFDNLVMGSTPDGYGVAGTEGYGVNGTRSFGNYIPVTAFSQTQVPPRAGYNSWTDSII